MMLRALLAVAIPYSAAIRGVSPEDAKAYAGAEFTCGGLTISAEQINDDYCDCHDGSDEPGTAACATGSFFCPNKGFTGRSIPSSRVNDGICDCCDGSDEFLSTCCIDTCAELRRESQKDIIAEIERHEKGAAIKQEWISKAIELRAEREAKVAALKVQLKEKEAGLELARKAKEEQEAVEKEENDRRSAIRKAKENENEGDEGDSDNVAKEGEVTNKATEEVADEAKETKEEENFPYPEEYRVKTGETEDQEAGEGNQEENFPYPEEYRVKKEETPGPEETAEEPKKEADITAEDEAQAEEEEDETGHFVSEAAETARKEFRETDSEYKALERELEEVQKELDNDYGLEGEYAPLLGQCFEAKIRQYTYSVCPFGKATQKDGGSTTSLGTFKEWQEEDGARVMSFQGGQRCWQGPERSLSVRLLCGTENIVGAVEEPSKCVYTTTLSTPAACSAEHAQALALE